MAWTRYEYSENLFPVFAALVVLLLGPIYVYLSRIRKLPPGPWGLPLLGYYPFIPENSHLHFAKLAEKYGPLFSFRTVGGTLIVVLHDVQLIREVLVNRADEFLGRIPGNNLISWISSGIGITQEEGENWKEQRKFFLLTAKSLGYGKVEKESLIQEKIKRLIDYLANSGGKPANIFQPLEGITGDAVCQILMSKNFSEDRVKFKEMAAILHDAFLMFVTNTNLLVGYAFDLLCIVSPSMRKATRSLAKTREVTDMAVDEHILTYDESNVRDYIDCYLQHMSELGGKNCLENSSFSIERLKANIFNFFIESTETTALVTGAMLIELSKHPDVQKRMQNELDDIVGHERSPSWADRTKLPFVDAVILELYRVAVPFFQSTIYSNFEETKIRGYRIPKRSAIIFSLWAVHNDPKIYPEPSRFNPERFLDRDGRRIKTETPSPFGFGRRSCIGEPVAQMMVFSIIATVTQKFMLFPSDDPERIIANQRK